jgi:tRNA(Ile)-lysidine synthase
MLRVLRERSVALGDGPLVLAVSGGPDSLAMLLAAVAASPALRRDLIVAHYSHGMRPSAERGEAALVRRLAKRFGLTLAHEQGAVGGSEESARDARYDFLSRVAREHGAAAVATAHTQDDQAETVLLRLTRGAGLRGAGAIRELSDRTVGDERVVLIRPLLSARRVDTQAVCDEWRIAAASDGTNRSLRYARNRVRRRVLPELGKISAAVTPALAAFAEQAQADDTLLVQLAREAIAGAEVRADERVTWPTAALADLPTPLFARVLQDAWAFLQGRGSTLGRAQIATARRVVLARSGTVALGSDAAVVVEQNRVTMSTRVAEAKAIEPIEMAIPGKINAGPWEIEAWLVRAPETPGDETYDEPWQAMLDASAVGTAVCIRTRQAGDRFQPLGMASDVRLQDVLVNAKVPRSLRDQLPLVVCERGIAWVPGVRIADWAKVRPDTTQVVVFQMPASS